MLGDQNHAHVFFVLFAVPNQVLYTLHEYRKNQLRALDIVIGHKALFEQIGQGDHQIV